MRECHSVQEISLLDLLPAIEEETTENPQFSVIWMHGLGADGSAFVPAAISKMGLDDAPGIRFVCPHAPFIPITCNGGRLMRSWYDVFSLDNTSRRVDEAGILNSRQAICSLIARENQRGIPSHRIFLGGFSQGAAVAYTTALTYPEKLAGLVALSSYIPIPRLLAKEATDTNRSIPIFIGHGAEDGVVSIDLGLAARNFLNQHRYRIEWHEYSTTHSVCLEEIKNIGTWLRAAMAESPLE
jgi:phospholipase/carboxylesterase